MGDDRQRVVDRVLPKIEQELESLQEAILGRMNGHYVPNRQEV